MRECKINKEKGGFTKKKRSVNKIFMSMPSAKYLEKCVKLYISTAVLMNLEKAYDKKLTGMPWVMN